MGYDFNNSNIFDKKRLAFYESINDSDVCAFLYALGVTLRSDHHKKKSYDLTAPFAEEFKQKWDLSIWIRATNGTDDFTEDEVYEREFDDALRKYPYFDYLLTQAVKYQRPDWSIFGLIGMMQGALNCSKYQIPFDGPFCEEDFIRCIQYLPADFLERYSEKLIYLFEYFDEIGLDLKIQTSATGNSSKIDVSFTDREL